MLGLLGCQRTLLTRNQLFTHRYPQVLLGRAALHPLIPQPVLTPEAAPTQQQDLALCLAERHEIHRGKTWRKWRVGFSEPANKLPVGLMLWAVSLKIPNKDWSHHSKASCFQATPESWHREVKSIKPLSKLGWLNQHPFLHRNVAVGGGSMSKTKGQKLVPPSCTLSTWHHRSTLSPVIPITGDPTGPEIKRLTAGKLLLVRCSA